jgi:four helix bundle protein
VIKSFRDLIVWKKGMEIVQEIYSFSSLLPKEEQYGLVSQMRRAAISLPSNIAEGFRRRNQREFRQFLHVSLGSAAELETQLELCRNLYKHDNGRIEKILDQLDHFQAVTMNLIKEIEL